MHAYQNVTYKNIQIEQTTNNDDTEHIFHKLKDTIIEPVIQTPSKKEENVQLDEAIIPLNIKVNKTFW